MTPSSAPLHASLHSPPLAGAVARSVSGWCTALTSADVPVLAATARVVEELRSNEDGVDAHLLAGAVSSDPLMMLKILAHVAELRRGREDGAPESVTAALVLLGITPFFRAFGRLQSVEDTLACEPSALTGFLEVLARSRRAANFALAFAVQRIDHDATLIQQAALLHDFVELLLWVRAPAQSLEIRRRQRLDPTLRSCVAQREVLGADVGAVRRELMRRWCLPRLLIEIVDDDMSRSSAQARTVLLAVRLARHSAASWDNAALPDDVQEIAELLHMSPDPTLALLREVDQNG